MKKHFPEHIDSVQCWCGPDIIHEDCSHRILLMHYDKKKKYDKDEKGDGKVGSSGRINTESIDVKNHDA